MTLRPLQLMAIAVVAAPGLILGPGIPVAGADELPTPRTEELRLDGDVAYVTYTDFADGESFYLITLVERENRNRIVAEMVSAPAASGTGRTATGQVSGIPAGVALCAWVRAVQSGTLAGSADSNSVCADPAVAPLDLALDNIKGNAAPKANASPAYLVALRNAGGVDATDVVVDISTSGVATLGDQGAVLGGWQASGFGCTPQAPSGGQTAALRCTGGKLKAGEQTNPAVIVKFTGPGPGTIHASIGRVGGAYANPGNDTSALNVNVNPA